MSNEENFAFGANPSPKDNRDYIYDAIALESTTGEIQLDEDLPEKFSLVKYLPQVRNQGRQGSCVAQAGACIKEYHECINYGFNTDRKTKKMWPLEERTHMSPQFMYNNREIYPRVGWHGRSLMDFLLKKGVCFEDTFPYNSKSDKDQQADGDVLRGDQIPASVWKEAENHKISAYARVQFVKGDVENNIYRLKKSLMTNGPAYIAFPVYKGARPEFWRNLDEDGNPRVRTGGHAVAVVGWDKTGFILRNSWGSKWNGNGYLKYPFEEYNQSKHWDLWTAIDGDSKYLVHNKKDSKKKCCSVQ